MAETDWAAKREAIRLAIAAGLRLPDKATIGGKRTQRVVDWEGRDSANRWAHGPVVDLRLGAVVGRGQLEPRYDYDAGTDRLIPTYGRLEHMTITVAIDVDTQEPGYTAPDTLASRLRTRLQRPDVRAILQAAGVSLVRTEGTVNGDYEDDGRMISAARLDLVLAHVAVDVDDSEDENGDWINEVHGNGVEGEDLEPVDLDVGPVL